MSKNCGLKLEESLCSIALYFLQNVKLVLHFFLHTHTILRQFSWILSKFGKALTIFSYLCSRQLYNRLRNVNKQTSGGKENLRVQIYCISCLYICTSTGFKIIIYQLLKIWYWSIGGGGGRGGPGAPVVMQDSVQTSLITNKYP